MNIKKIWILVLALCLLCGCSSTPVQTTEPEQTTFEAEGDILEFRPVDVSFPPMDAYDFPFLGMTAKLSESILSQIESKEIFAFTFEDYTQENTISYALLRFSTTTEAQREEKGMSVDIFSWEAALSKLGAIGVYHQSLLEQLDMLTACDTHSKIGESADGTYAYYISTASQADDSLKEALLNSQITICPMHALDMNMGYTAFSSDRIDGIENVGFFSTEDILGNAYNQDVFADNTLTLVNVFATWCQPCIEEMPELEKLQKAYQDKGIRLGVVAIVPDTVTENGRDAGALERAKEIYADSGVTFPFLLPDSGYMNGRLSGIAAVPESFFVDSSGNIVSEPYTGAKTLEQWSQIVDSQLQNS